MMRSFRELVLLWLGRPARGGLDAGRHRLGARTRKTGRTRRIAVHGVGDRPTRVRRNTDQRRRSMHRVPHHARRLREVGHDAGLERPTRLLEHGDGVLTLPPSRVVAAPSLALRNSLAGQHVERCIGEPGRLFRRSVGLAQVGQEHHGVADVARPRLMQPGLPGRHVVVVDVVVSEATRGRRDLRDRVLGLRDGRGAADHQRHHVRHQCAGSGQLPGLLPVVLLAGFHLAVQEGRPLAPEVHRRGVGR